MKILLIKTSSLGDIVQAFPCIEALKENIPHLELSWMVEKPFSTLVHTHPKIDQVFEVETKAWRKGKNLSTFFDLRKELLNHTFDIVFDIQGNLKSGILLSLVKAKEKVGFGWESVPEKLNLLFTKKKILLKKGKSKRLFYLKMLESYFQRTLPISKTSLLNLNKEETLLLEEIKEEVKKCLHPIFFAFGSFWKNKKLPLSAWQKLFYNEKDLFTTFGNEEEKKEAEDLKVLLPQLKILPKLSLPLLQNLFPYFDKIFGVDSLLLHLAGTSASHVVGIFGPSLGTVYAPFPHLAIQGRCPYQITFNERCPKLRTCKTGACLKHFEFKVS